jgi:hypothetical protein
VCMLFDFISHRRSRIFHRNCVYARRLVASV